MQALSFWRLGNIALPMLPRLPCGLPLCEGLERPAAEVRAIVVTQSQRISSLAISDSGPAEAYPEAKILCLMGACCEGMYAKVLDPVFSKTERVYCHQWAQVLPEWLRCCGATRGQTLKIIFSLSCCGKCNASNRLCSDGSC